MKRKKVNVIAGVDYSTTSPAMCIHVGEEWSFENCTFFFCNEHKHFDGLSYKQKYYGFKYPTEKEIGKFAYLANSFTDMMHINGVECVAIEDYAFAAKGQVFKIGENTGLLKYMMYIENLEYETYAPSAIKKFATGKGNAKKDQMYAAWSAETGADLVSLFSVKHEGLGAIPDIVDAYYICKLLWENMD